MDPEPIIDLHSDHYFMGEALRQAVRAYEAEEVPVGAVVVHKGRVIARDFNHVELLQDATAMTNKAPGLAVSTNYPSEFRVRKNQGVTTLTPGHVLVTWQFDEESKRCLLFLIQPVYEPESASFTIRTKALETDWKDPARSPVESLPLPNSLAQWSDKTLSSETAEELVKTWETMSGSDVLSAPTLTTADRREAMIQVNQMKEWQGTNYPVGLTFKLVPLWNGAPQKFTDGVGAQPNIRLGWSAEVAELRKEFEPPKPATPKPEE